MKISVTCRQDDLRQAVEDEVARLVPKLSKLLKHYSPDLVVLRGSFEKQPRKTEHHFALNLSLPTGTLHAVSSAAEVRGTVHLAFTELEVQLKKHIGKVRRDFEWKRKRGREEHGLRRVIPATD